MFDVRCSACGWATTAATEESAAEIGRAHRCGSPLLLPCVTVMSREASERMADRERVLAALSALRAYVNAAVDLSAAWEKLGPFDVLTENVPQGFVEFDEQVTDLIIWRDRVARALGEPEGNGSADDEVPPRPPEIPADEPEDPALDIEGGDGTTLREEAEARARLAAYRGAWTDAGQFVTVAAGASGVLVSQGPASALPVVGVYSGDGLLCAACGAGAREQLAEPPEKPPEKPWREVRRPEDFTDAQRACVSCMKTLFPEPEPEPELEVSAEDPRGALDAAVRGLVSEVRADLARSQCPRCKIRGEFASAGRNRWRCTMCGTVISTPTDEADREERAARDVLEVWPQLRPQLDALAAQDADLFSEGFTKALREVRRLLAVIVGKA